MWMYSWCPGARNRVQRRLGCMQRAYSWGAASASQPWTASTRTLS